MYIIRGADQKEYGPVPTEMVRRWIAERRLDGRSLVQEVGINRWKPLAEYPEFAASLAEAPRPPLVRPPTIANPAGTTILSGTAPVSGLAVASFVLGVLGFCTGFTAILGLIFGGVALRQIGKSRGQLRGRGLAMAGLVFSVLAIVILPALVLPTLSRRSRMIGGGNPTGECVSHAQELSRAVRMYANDNNDFFPPGERWCDAIQRDLSHSGMFQCPARPGLRSAFTLNAAVAGRKDQDVDPGTVILFESEEGWNQSGGADRVTRNPRHGRSVVVAFADGSVRLVNASEVSQLRWNP